ncbi:LysR family transcriptional regulator [Metabacillus sediminilitoris]|uniref:LysR family transcriptional regulator n=1 Tax=Metabacillus sediminilitoris TaxID=2567941 RepID=A0A4S4C3L5_9BACI|nr:LysR family transcriptional regulator [Metabacillus sediminilitoris]QGQ45359.1 LysR family transcriptional regulator [Metabacillus sediminilitoris]THF82343.1 LysR family transcriptional regulator [Metabacillus sediminilitoris]
MTLQQLKYVIEIVLCGSINEAARRLYMTQPSLSKAVKDLEKELGIDIFLRTSKGITLSRDGAEFLGYARQVVEQAELLERRYFDASPSQQLFSVSTQHYAFAVNAFVEMIKKHGASEYQFTLRETRTYEIIENVKNLRSEIGILYLSSFNEKVMTQIMKEEGLDFHPLFEAKPHIFISAQNPLASRLSVSLEDLDAYPRLSFEQGEYNSFYYAEEMFSTIPRKKSIQVSDRATLFNLLIGLNGYTISTGVLSTDLNGSNIVSVPLDVDETITVGWIVHKKTRLSRMANIYLEELKQIIDYYTAS